MITQQETCLLPARREVTELNAMHAAFMETMYPYFGLPSEPVKTRVIVSEYIRNSMVSCFRGSFFIEISAFGELRKHDIYHESGHLLHCYASPAFNERLTSAAFATVPKDKQEKRKIREMTHLGEFVAEYSALLFCHSQGRLTDYINYQQQRPKSYGAQYYSITTEAYKKNPNLLPRIAYLDENTWSNELGDYIQRMDEVNVIS